MANVREKIVNQITYYLSFSFFVIAKQAHNTLLEHEKLLGSIYGKTSDILNMIYDPAMKGTKQEFDDFLDKNGYMIDWKGKMNIKKEEAEETPENVG